MGVDWSLLGGLGLVEEIVLTLDGEDKLNYNGSINTPLGNVFNVARKLSGLEVR